MARQLARKLGISEVSLNPYIRSRGVLDVADSELVFVAPTYCWRLPRVVGRWMSLQPSLRGRKAWFVLTCGDDFGNAEAYLADTCKEVGLEFMGGIEVVMPENYIAMFKAPSERECGAIVASADATIETVARYLKDRRHFPKRRVGLRDRFVSGPVNPLFYKLSVSDRKFRVKDSCVGCGRCESVCPMGNIVIREGRPRWQGSCTHCMACICRCPKEAIEYGRATEGKRRYFIDA